MKWSRHRANVQLIISSPTIFWRLPQVLFRGTWTYQKVEPSFTKMPQQTSSLSIAEVEEYNPSIQQNEQQNPTIDRIASSVIAGMKDEAIAAMKDAFTALRMEELNGPDPGSATKKLKEEIDTLKRENEALKRGDQDTGKQKELPNVQNSDWLQGSRKRPWTDEFPNGRTKPMVQCSQTDDDDMTDSRLADKPQSETMHVPFNDDNQQTSPRNDTSKQITPGSLNLRTDENELPSETPDSVSTSHRTRPEQRNTIVKRLRLSNEPAMEVGKRKSRQKKSNTAPNNKPVPTPAPKHHPEQPVRRGRGRGRPRGSSLRRRVRVVSEDDDDGDDASSPQSSSRLADNAQQRPLNGGEKSPSVHDSEKENTSRTTKNTRRNKASNESAEKHRQLVAMRDRMAEEAMRHEEELAGEVGYYG